MGRFLVRAVLWGWVTVVGGCGYRSEAVVFEHPDEVVTGQGQAEGYWALADRRVFATMAFLNAAGYDDEIAGAQMYPLRVKVRRMVAENLADNPEESARLREYYEKRRLGAWQYVNFSLSLSADYPFRRIRPGGELAYRWTDWMLADFCDVLNDFWVDAELERVWAACADDYAREVAACDPDGTRGGIEGTWAYLRMIRSDDYTIVRVPNPLERHATANGHRFENYFYSVEGPSSGGYVHEYLHTIINGLVEANCAAHRDKLMGYFNAGKDAEISASYQQLSGWVSECLIHALCSRMIVLNSDEATGKRVEQHARVLTEGGYTLLWPLYEESEGFERSHTAFDEYLPVMLEKLRQY